MVDRADRTLAQLSKTVIRVELLIIDGLALHRLGATEISDFYELIDELHRSASTIITQQSRHRRS